MKTFKHFTFMEEGVNLLDKSYYVGNPIKVTANLNKFIGDAGYKEGDTFQFISKSQVSIDYDKSTDEFTTQYSPPHPQETEQKIFTVSKSVKSGWSVLLQEIDTSDDNIQGEIIEILGNKSHITASFGGTKSRGQTRDPHELMTAALILAGNSIISSVSGATSSEADEIIEKLKPIAPEVDGWDQLDLDAFDEDYDALAGAASAAKAVIDEFEGTIKKVYITGKTWSPDIAQFANPEQATTPTIKVYNSSDIVVGDGIKFLGVSLKKKTTIKDADPTLINKAILGDVGFFNTLLDAGELEKIKLSKVKIFYDMLEEEDLLEDEWGSSDRDLMANEKSILKKAAKQLGNDIINKKLKSPKNIFFKSIHDSLVESKPDVFLKRFLSLVFRVKMADLGKEVFDFSLITGVGKIVGGKLKVDSPDIKDIQTVSRMFYSLFDGSNKITVEADPDKRQVWDTRGTNAAKVFLKVFVKPSGKRKMGLIDIEIRYKGAFTASPQFQAVVSSDFQEFYEGYKTVK